MRGVAARRRDPRAGRVRLGHRGASGRRAPRAASGSRWRGLERARRWRSPGRVSRSSTPGSPSGSGRSPVPHARSPPRSRTRSAPCPRTRAASATRAARPAASRCRIGGQDDSRPARLRQLRQRRRARCRWRARSSPACCAAAAELPARVLLTLGQPTLDIDALGPLPPNLHVERWVPPADVLGHADAGGAPTAAPARRSGRWPRACRSVVVPAVRRPARQRPPGRVGAGLVASGPTPTRRPSRSAAASTRGAARGDRDRARGRGLPSGRRASLAARWPPWPPIDGWPLTDAAFGHICCVFLWGR